MIVDSMGYEEIAAEFQSDYKSEIEPKLFVTFGMEAKYRRYLMKEAKNDELIFFKPIKLTSKKGNNYIIQYYCEGWAGYKRNNLIYFIYLYYHRPDGLYAVLHAEARDATRFMVYTPHFFDRYRERCMGDGTVPKLQVIQQCFRYNHNFAVTLIDSEKYKDNVLSTLKEGIGLGNYITPLIIEFRTFVSLEMMKEDQIEIMKEYHPVMLRGLEYERSIINKMARAYKAMGYS